MKARTIIIAAMLAAGTTASAQFRIDSCGRVAAGGYVADTVAALSVGNTTMHGSGYSIGVYSSTPSTNLCNIGVEGVALPTTPNGSGRSIGVRGMAGHGPAGRNYGVLGALGDSLPGAGITGSDGLSTMTSASGRYAGLFYGDISAKGTTATRLVNDYDAPSTQADTISNPAILLYPVRTYVKRYRTDIINGDSGVIVTGRTIPGDFHRDYDTTTIVNTPTYEYHYSVIPASGISPGLMVEDAQGRTVVNYTELVPLMAETAWKIAMLFHGRNMGRVLSGEISPLEAAEIEGWTPDDAVALLAMAVAREDMACTNAEIPGNAVDVTLMFFDEGGALLSQRTLTDSERMSSSIGQCPDGATYCAIIADGAEVQTVRVAR